MARAPAAAPERVVASEVKLSPEFWHRLLAAELNPMKCRDLLRGLGTSNLEPDDFVLASPLLTANEKRRFQDTDLGPFQELVQQGMRVVTPDAYPAVLSQAPLLPPALFTWGNWDAVFGPTVAIVGTRDASTYGKAVAQKFAEALARAGATIVSGGALGIDAAAHKGALAAGGKTVAVLITGLDRVYPREHAGLFTRIRENQGCLISQFAVGGKMAWEFRPLIRNQTVAALSQITLVIEAPSKSGALSTAHAANELGRPVFVVPANIDNLNFRGSHALIRDGATLVDHPQQLMDIVGIRPPVTEATPASSLSDAQRKILSVLSVQPLASEFIVDRTGLATADVLSELTLLELEGLVIRDSGGYAIRP